MRAPLRAVTNEANAAGPLAPKQTEPDDEIHEWRRRWCIYMNESVIYFDDIPRELVQSYRPHFQMLGATIQPFYDSNVTHVISNRQSGDVVAKAREKNLKVYTNDKLTRFMGSLTGYAPPMSGDSGQSAKLDQLLENEKRQNTVNAAYARKESNFHTFRGPYILVYDPQHVNRPLAIKEWRPATDSDDGSWPQLRRVPRGMCPFVPRSAPKATKRKQQHQLQQPQPQHPLEGITKRRALAGPSAPGLAGLGLHEPVREEPVDIEHRACPDTAITHIPQAARCVDAVNPLAPDANAAMSGASTTPQHTLAPANVEAVRADDKDKENNIPGASLAVATPSMQPLSQTQVPSQATQASAQLRDFGEIIASGVQRYSQTSTKSFAANVGPSREIANLKRKVLATAPAPSRPRAEPKGEKTAKKPGFCENCLARYEHLGEHLKSQSHVMFATNEKRFQPLREALFRFERNRKRAPLQS